MSTTTAASAKSNREPQEIGFSKNVDWQQYITFRPLYAPSFYHRIFTYHASKPSASWNKAHDVGAGCGIVSSVLGSNFSHVVVSDPSTGYTDLARQLLVDKAGFPDTRFSFLQAKAEEMGAATGSVDLLTACQCMHWTDTDAAVSSFSKQLKSGGTLAMTGYFLPVLRNEVAQEHWRSIYYEWVKRNNSDVYQRAYPMVVSGFESIGLPADTWTDVKRVYINTQGTLDRFLGCGAAVTSKFHKNEERVFVEDDKAWILPRDIAWLKAHHKTCVVPVPEEDVAEHWDAIEEELKGGTVDVEFAVVMILATKR